MERIKKGDIVGRISYGKDILFEVERIIKVGKGKKIAILRGITIRIEADSELEDLQIMDEETIAEHERKLEKRFAKKLLKCENDITKSLLLKRSEKIIYTGKILHLDGDKRYSQKSNVFYKKMGLKAVVRNVPESRQPSIVVRTDK